MDFTAGWPSRGAPRKHSIAPWPETQVTSSTSSPSQLPRPSPAPRPRTLPAPPPSTLQHPGQQPPAILGINLERVTGADVCGKHGPRPDRTPVLRSPPWPLGPAADPRSLVSSRGAIATDPTPSTPPVARSTSPSAPEEHPQPPAQEQQKLGTQEQQSQYVLCLIPGTRARASRSHRGSRPDRHLASQWDPRNTSRSGHGSERQRAREH